MTQKTDFNFQDYYGKVTISLDDNIIIAHFNGSISNDVVDYFNQATQKLFPLLENKPWGYVSCSDLAQAATPEALGGLIKSAQNFLEAGCVSSAYVLTSPIAKSQMQKMRAAVGITDPLEDVTYETLEIAVEQVRKNLASLAAS